MSQGKSVFITEISRIETRKKQLDDETKEINQ
jgi:uncharacterized protein (UPF0335 family)